jgi:hypothetical protein
MRPPIFYWEPNEMIVYDSVESATSSTEPYDVDEGTVYDADGRLLAFETDRPGRVWEKRVVLRECESEPTHEPELRVAIMQALRIAGIGFDPSAPLGQLTDAAYDRFRVSAIKRRWRFANPFAKPS